MGSGIVRPKGRSPAGVYWRRRLVLVAVLLLAAAGVVKFVGDGGQPDASASSSDSAAVGDGDEHDGGTKQGGRDSRRTPKAPGSQDRDVRSGERNVDVAMKPADACDPAKVTVTPSVGAEAYAGGEVTLRLGLSTAGSSPCVLSLAEDAPLVSISSDDEQVWTSRRCDDLVARDEVRLAPGWTAYVDARWSGRASGRACGENADFAEPGEYAVRAAVLGGEPKKTTISLSEEPEKDESEGEKQKDAGDEGADRGGEVDDSRADVREDQGGDHPGR